MYVFRRSSGEQVAVPEALRVLVLVALGSIAFSGVGPLGEDDAVRLTAGGPQSIVAGDSGAEIIVWAMF